MDDARVEIRTQAGYQLRLPADATLRVLNGGLEAVDVPAEQVRIGQILPIPLGDAASMVPAGFRSRCSTRATTRATTA